MAVQDSFITDFDMYLFSEGTHYHLYNKLGAHLVEEDGKTGVRFCVWAPNAHSVSVMGDFNYWQPREYFMHPVHSTGIWSVFIPNLKQGDIYKYYIESNYNGYSVEKFDPVAFASEMRPRTASVVWDVDSYAWNDDEWIEKRKQFDSRHSAVSIYEVHMGSWARVPEDGNRFLTYREMADRLVPYVKEMGYTHVEFMPVSEHPLDASWGYQSAGYFSPTRRFGTPDDFKFLVDALHQNGIGVILDWVPAHFPSDEHGLAVFDGTHLYEHFDPCQREHKDWGTYIFNYGRYEISNFLIANALFWFDKYHVDGLRVDAVASMLYLDYSREDGEWTPNCFGGNENLEAISFMQRLNEQVYKEFPNALMFAEESTAWPQVSKPVYVGGLGFGYKWDLGWMHDTLYYMTKNPVHRKYHQNSLTFRGLYAFSESFVLPLSHDEVVHGKQSLLSQMPGDMWQKFANLRTLYSYMYAVPGKKLLFMGSEFGQWDEWNFDQSLDWHLLGFPLHNGLKNAVGDLNRLYVQEPALHDMDCDPAGFEWIDCNDADNCVMSFMRKGKDCAEKIVVVCNFTPVPRYDYHVGVPGGGYWKELFNSDAGEYGGSGTGNCGGVWAEPWSWHNQSHLVKLTLPPLGVIMLKQQDQ